jgi:hypothetical protein
VSNHQQILLEFDHHPVRSIQGGFAIFIEVASTPAM